MNTYRKSSGSRWALGLAAGFAGYVAMKSMQQARNLSMRNRVAVVAGGSRGLGLEIARVLIERGAQVALLARDADELERAKADLATRGGKVLTLPCDITQGDQVRSAIEDVQRTLGPIDVLINNAGMISVSPLDNTDEADFRDSLNLHFWGPYYTTTAVLPGMRERRRGRIVNISSIGGKISVPHLLPYSTGKFALSGYSEGLRPEVIRDNVYVTSVYPGLMRTGSPRNAFFKGQHRAEYAWFSISDSLPGLTVDSRTAAEQIVNACQRGDATLIISFPAKLAIKAHGIFPALTSAGLTLAARLLPAPGPEQERKKGSESFSKASPSFLTTLNEQAAKQNNQVSVSETSAG
ncbi:MAG: SDR family NAD(P)-dependent oxidoreductase [Acidobacteriales bacterium]|nr:SDR family NAD(P)-dependent oxidoreductase [Terriglobales bacterium]